MSPIVYALIDLKRWSWRGIVGVSLVVLAYVLPRLLVLTAGQSDILDHADLLGMVLIGVEVALARAQMPPGSQPPPGAPPLGGVTLTPLRRSAIDIMRPWRLLALLLCLPALAGCASQERNGETLGFQLRPDPERPKPACLYRLTIDGELLHKGAIDECPAVPVCEVPGVPEI